MSTFCSILLKLSTQAILRGYKDSGGPPLTFAQTVSPMMKALFGVVQSEAKVSTRSGSPGAGGSNEASKLGAAAHRLNVLIGFADLTSPVLSRVAFNAAPVKAGPVSFLRFAWEETTKSPAPSQKIIRQARKTRFAFLEYDVAILD